MLAAGLPLDHLVALCFTKEKSTIKMMYYYLMPLKKNPKKITKTGN